MEPGFKGSCRQARIVVQGFLKWERVKTKKVMEKAIRLFLNGYTTSLLANRRKFSKPVRSGPRS